LGFGIFSKQNCSNFFENKSRLLNFCVKNSRQTQTNISPELNKF